MALVPSSFSLSLSLVLLHKSDQPNSTPRWTDVRGVFSDPVGVSAFRSCAQGHVAQHGVCTDEGFFAIDVLHAVCGLGLLPRTRGIIVFGGWLDVASGRMSQANIL